MITLIVILGLFGNILNGGLIKLGGRGMGR